MIQKLKGASLIEVLVATGVIAVGILLLYAGFLQSNRIASRNATTEIGLNILNSAIDSDSKVAYNSFPNEPSETAVAQLPNGKLYRSVNLTEICDPNKNPQSGVKIINYTLYWSGSDGEHTLKAEYELVNKGLANDNGA